MLNTTERCCDSAWWQVANHTHMKKIDFVKQKMYRKKFIWGNIKEAVIGLDGAGEYDGKVINWRTAEIYRYIKERL